MSDHLEQNVIFRMVMYHKQYKGFIIIDVKMWNYARYCIISITGVHILVADLHATL